MSFTLHGLSVSQGVAIGRALTISAASLEVNHQFIQEDQCELEVDLLKKAFSKALEELKKLNAIDFESLDARSNASQSLSECEESKSS